MDQGARAGVAGRAHGPAVWRGGVHIANTPVWCDAPNPHGICFVSAAHALTAAGRGQLLGTATALAMLPEPSSAEAAPETRLPVPYDRPFTLGTRRLELIRSGHAAGSAGLWIEVDGHRILYTGALGRTGPGLGGQPDCRTCDTLVVASNHGIADAALPEPSRAAEETLAFVRDAFAAGNVAVLLLSSAGKALDVAAHLHDAGIPIAGHPDYVRAARRARAAGVGVPALARAGGDRSGEFALLWPASARRRLDGLRLRERSRVALVSAAAARPDAVREIRADAGFPWSNEADFPSLLAYVEATRAERVYTTGSGARAIARALGQTGRPAQALAAPEQLALF